MISELEGIFSALNSLQISILRRSRSALVGLSMSDSFSMIRLESWQVEINGECSKKDLEGDLKSLCPAGKGNLIWSKRDDVDWEAA